MNYFKHHKFWAILMVISCAMCVLTGHWMTAGHGDGGEKEADAE